jgi:UDP:flavonoid glycosyltransferase YjiC (YdhE family)
MSRFLLAWEIGAGYGHLTMMLPLADELARRGHEPVFAVRNVAAAQFVLAGRDYALLQAPTWVGEAPPGPSAATYPGILIKRGYDQPEHVAGLLRAWLGLLELLRPDFLIADYAPGAVLAARVAGVPAGSMGTGFFCPPRASPMPIFFGQQTTAEAQQRVEQAVLDNINGALAAVGARPLRVLADMLAPVDDALCTFPELDHYGARPEGTYWGAIDQAFGAARPSWPSDLGGPRVFAYLRAAYAGLGTVVEALDRLGLPTILHVGGSVVTITSQGAVAYSPEAVDMGHVLQEATLVICHASHGTVTQALLHGVPLLLLPLHNEQAPVRDRVAAFGAGVGGPRSRDPSSNFEAAIARAINDPQLLVAATAFAERYAGFDPASVPVRIIDFYESVLADRKAMARA